MNKASFFSHNNTMMKNKYLSKSIVITMGVVIAKAISLLYVYPFAKMISKEGLALYNYAYVPYTIFLDLSTLGFPLAIAKLTAKYQKTDQEYLKKITTKILVVSSILAFISFLTLYLIAPLYAKTILGGSSLTNTIENVTVAIRIIAISLIIVPFLSIYRGIYQGLEEASVYAKSQVFEQIIRVSIILISTYLIVKKYLLPDLYAIYLAILACSISAFFALFYLYLKRKKIYQYIEKPILVSNWRSVEITSVFKYAIPFLIFGVSSALYQLIDSLYVNNILQQNGIINSEEIYGIYSFEIIKLLHIPLAFAQGFSIMILPNVTKENTNINKAKNVSKGLSIIFLITLSFAFLFCLFAKTIYPILYTKNDLGISILKASAFLVPIFALYNFTINVLLGLDQIKTAYISIILGIIIKIITIKPLLTEFNINGAIISTFIGFFISVVINFINMMRILNIKRNI